MALNMDNHVAVAGLFAHLSIERPAAWRGYSNQSTVLVSHTVLTTLPLYLTWVVALDVHDPGLRAGPD